MAPDYLTLVRRWGPLGTLCVLQVAGAAVAALAIWMEVESIVVAGPLLATLGLVIAIVAVAIRSTSLLLYGLWHPLMTAAVAWAIGGFRLGPNDIDGVAGMAAIVNAGLVGAWCGRIFGRPEVKQAGLLSLKRPVSLRFSLRSVLVAMTVLCVVLAIAAGLTWRGEWPYFSMYGAIMLALAAVLVARFVWRPVATAGVE
jgi:hypothetical protein